MEGGRQQCLPHQQTRMSAPHVRVMEMRTGVQRMALALAGFLWLFAIAPASAQTTRPAVPNPLAGRTVEEVPIRGNPTVPTSIIRNVIRTRVGAPYDPAT